MLPPSPWGLPPHLKRAFLRHRVHFYSFTSQNLNETQSHSHSSSHLISTYHIISNVSRIHIYSVYRIHVVLTFSVYIYIIHTSSYLHCISILIPSSPLLSPHPCRVSVCHVILSVSYCHTHMSSCHVSTCHDIVSYHINYHCVFTFVT